MTHPRLTTEAMRGVASIVRAARMPIQYTGNAKSSYGVIARASISISQAKSETALQMTQIGPLSDIAHHDLARVLFSLEREDEAIRHQRLAYRRSPAARRSFHLWSLATYQHYSGKPEDALASLRRAERWAARDRPVILAHAAYVELDAGGAPEGLSEIVSGLETSDVQEGYGQYLLGMIATLVGDTGRAETFLRAFLRRNAGIDVVKALSLAEELRRARSALARLSD